MHSSYKGIVYRDFDGLDPLAIWTGLPLIYTRSRVPSLRRMNTFPAMCAISYSRQKPCLQDWNSIRLSRIQRLYKPFKPRFQPSKPYSPGIWEPVTLKCGLVPLGSPLG